MRFIPWLLAVFTLIACFIAVESALASGTELGQVSSAPTTQPDGLRALEGEWIYVEDRTDGRSLERLGPPMSSTFSIRVEEDAVILVRGHGSRHRDVRIALDGTVTEIVEPKTTTRYRGEWKDGELTYEVTFIREAGGSPEGLIRRVFRATPEGLLVRASSGSAVSSESVAIYRQSQDIAMPTPAKATIGDLAWLAGDWVGTRGTSGTTTIEERWGPPLGGSMLGVSRTVSRGTMSAFEYLRVVEREGGLIYIAQPNGGAATEFVLSEFTATRAVFDNPRHDYPKRIVYELTPEGGLSATIGFMKGGSPRRFEFKRESR